MDYGYMKYFTGCYNQQTQGKICSNESCKNNRKSIHKKKPGFFQSYEH